MALFKKRSEVKDVERLTKKNAREIARIEKEDLVRIKRRQDVIERRLAIMQKELDVQTRKSN